MIMTLQPQDSQIKKEDLSVMYWESKSCTVNLTDFSIACSALGIKRAFGIMQYLGVGTLLLSSIWKLIVEQTIIEPSALFLVCVQPIGVGHNANAIPLLADLETSQLSISVDALTVS